MDDWDGILLTPLEVGELVVGSLDAAVDEVENVACITRRGKR
jgi:hypothetical protein